MAATSTLRQILIEIAERYGLGKVVPLSSNTTTTLTLTTTGSPELRGPRSGAGIPVMSPVVITVETAGTSVLGNRTYISKFDPTSGVATVSPAIGDTDATECIIWKPEIKDPDRVLEAVNRAIQNRIGNWQLKPLTFVADGDMGNATVSDHWAAGANGTVAYSNATVFPTTGNADIAGITGLSKVVQLTTSGGSSTVTGNGIRVPVSTTQRGWYFLTAIRLVSGTGTAEFKVLDNTNTTSITLQVTRGNDSNTLTTTTLGDFMICEGTFQLPSTCAEIAPQMTLSATGMVGQLAPIIMFPLSTTQFPLSNRIETQEQIGNFYTSVSLRSPGALYDQWIANTEAPLEHRLFDYGDHRTVLFNTMITRPVWYEEYVNGTALTSMTSTTTFPLDRIARWAYAELVDQLMRDEMGEAKRAENGALMPSAWRALRNAAFKSAMNSGYEPRLKNVVGRR